jgi:hypothetical protein
MNRRKMTLVLAVALLVACFGILGGQSLAVKAYGAPCGKLAGFPGLLQSLNFVPSADCRTNKDGSCANSAACNVTNPPSGEGEKGKCTTTTTSTKKGVVKGCVCMPK